MSRFARYPISVPLNIKCNILNNNVVLEGPHGTLQLLIHKELECTLNNNSILIVGNSMQQGTLYRNIKNAIHGLTELHKRTLELKGIGYKALIENNKLVMSLGYCHPIIYTIPTNIIITCSKPTTIEISGVDKAQVGQCAANIVMYRRPSAFKKGYIAGLWTKTMKKVRK